MSPCQWSSMQRIVAFSRDMTLTFRFRPGLVVASGVPQQGASITGGEMAGRLILTTMECVFKLRTCTQAPGYRPKGGGKGPSNTAFRFARIQERSPLRVATRQ